RAGPRRPRARRDGARDPGRDRVGAPRRLEWRDGRGNPGGGATGGASPGVTRRPAETPAAAEMLAGVAANRPRVRGGKLGARFDGRPVLQHVLDALADAGFDDPIVVLAPDVDPPGIDWRRAERITNPDPGRGLASSLRLAWQQALAGDPVPAAVLITLGDQPLVRAEVIR